MSGPVTGGCQCGAVRFRAERLGRASVCHCRMCQRAAGNVFAVLVSAEGVTFEGEPGRWASSDIATRGFCRTCGTPLFYKGSAGQGLNLMVGALDDPGAAPAALQYGIESRIAWLSTLDDLPAHETRPGGLTGRGPDIINSFQDPAALAAKEAQ